MERFVASSRGTVWKVCIGDGAAWASLSLGTNGNDPILADAQVDTMRMAANGAVLYIGLAATSGEVNGNDDFLAADLAIVAGFIHGSL